MCFLSMPYSMLKLDMGIFNSRIVFNEIN